MASEPPNTKIPRVMNVLLEAIKTKNGFQTEGIFRVSAQKSLVDNLQEQLEKGNMTISGNDPHVPACCLKMFLYQLKDSVIPQHLYHQCIAITDGKRQTQQTVEQILNQLENHYRYLLQALIIFLRELAAPQNVIVNKMGLASLAVVFTPCLIRCPSYDPAEIIQNSAIECTFIQSLFENWQF